MKKTTVAVVFGGRSGEHEVSLVSATSVVKALDPEKYQIKEVGITEEGVWMEGENCLEKFKQKDFSSLTEVNLSTNPDYSGHPDIFFPVLHGPFGEDGTIQGLFEMLNVAYVGCGVVASSTAMDKIQCKAIWSAFGLPVVDYFAFRRSDWNEGRAQILKSIKEQIGFPCFVKPVNMGSSVGVSKVSEEEKLVEALELAMRYDRKIMIEKGLNVREIECAVLGNDRPFAAPLGEVIVGGEFYDFHDKYVNGVSSTEVPAKLEPKMAKKIEEICLRAYKLLDCAGLARVDAFIDKDSGKIFLNEINTMPGFTAISMYPKMMEAHGLEYGELIDQLIELGIERHKEKQKNTTKFSSESDWYLS